MPRSGFRIPQAAGVEVVAAPAAARPIRIGSAQARQLVVAVEAAQLSRLVIGCGASAAARLVIGCGASAAARLVVLVDPAQAARLVVLVDPAQAARLDVIVAGAARRLLDRPPGLPRRLLVASARATRRILLGGPPGTARHGIAPRFGIAAWLDAVAAGRLRVIAPPCLGLVRPGRFVVGVAAAPTAWLVVGVVGRAVAPGTGVGAAGSPLVTPRSRVALVVAVHAVGIGLVVELNVVGGDG